MITIYKNKQDIPNELEYIELNDLFFNQNTVTLLGDTAKEVIDKVDQAKLISKYKISSKFNDVVLDIDKLSAGCKTVLNVLYNPDKVFCMKECGNNALELLFSLEEGNVYSEYALIPFNMKSVLVHDKITKKIISDYEELKEWWCDEE